MSDAPVGRGGFRGGFGDRGRGRGRGRRRGRGRGLKEGEKEWVPVTKLGRLVKDGKIKKLEEIYLFALPIKVIANDATYYCPVAELVLKCHLRIIEQAFLLDNIREKGTVVIHHGVMPTTEAGWSHISDMHVFYIDQKCQFWVNITCF